MASMSTGSPAPGWSAASSMTRRGSPPGAPSSTISTPTSARSAAEEDMAVDIESTRAAPAATARAHGIPFSDALRVWARVAALSFGGPAGQIAVMHRILVEEKRWIGEARFLHALNYCMLLPGPEAQQLAIYIGWLLHTP